jgi:hypothetical protein
LDQNCVQWCALILAVLNIWILLPGQEELKTAKAYIPVYTVNIYFLTSSNFPMYKIQ